MKAIKELVKGNVKLTQIKEGKLWYVTECGFLFPVPVTDLGEGEFKFEDKGMYFMRWIRKEHEVQVRREELAAFSKVGFAFDPVHKDDRDEKWYFYDETGAHRYGPYNDETEARSRLKTYCEQVLNGSVA